MGAFAVDLAPRAGVFAWPPTAARSEDPRTNASSTDLRFFAKSSFSTIAWNDIQVGLPWRVCRGATRRQALATDRRENLRGQSGRFAFQRGRRVLNGEHDRIVVFTLEGEPGLHGEHVNRGTHRSRLRATPPPPTGRGFGPPRPLPHPASAPPWRRARASSGLSYRRFHPTQETTMISQTQSHSAPSGAKNLEVPVLIVGGGGAGLTASMLLSQLGVEHLLVSALPTTSILPKAHVLNQKTMEILTDVGVAEEIYAKSTPAENMRAMGWYAGLAGPDPDFGRRIAQIESWGDGYTNLNWVAASPCRSGQPSADPPGADLQGARRSAESGRRALPSRAAGARAGCRRRDLAHPQSRRRQPSTRCARSTSSAATAAGRSRSRSASSTTAWA